jgi:NitT/TauT family transport system permease protein
MSLAVRLADRGLASLRFLWGAWAGVAALGLLAALWQAGHEAYGDFILPAPLATLSAAIGILSEPRHWTTALETTRRAVQGFALAALAGASLGLVAGYSAATLRLVRPLITVILGVPPIAWIVLAMIWFGSTDGTVVVTILIAATPLVFAGVAEGVATRDRGLDDMARAFGASALQRVATVGMRHVLAHLFPALAIAIGTAFKVAVMAELLANTGGVGGALASARANLDVATALAWVLIAVGVLILFEYLVIHPIRASFERWRDAARPWGVKR